MIPIFGLAVTGSISIEKSEEKQYCQVRGFVVSHQTYWCRYCVHLSKKKAIKEEHYLNLVAQLTTVNKVGEATWAKSKVYMP